MYTTIWATFINLEIEQNHKQAEIEKKMYDDLQRERDILSKVTV